MSVTSIDRPQAGIVLEVSEIPTGTNLSQAATIGNTVIYVEDVADFSATGGQLQMNGVTYSYLSTDEVTSSITLSTALTGPIDENIAVILLPLSYEKWALVQIDPEEDAIRARVPHTLADKFVTGIREEDDRESVLVYIERTEWTILDIVALQPEVDGAYIMPDSIDETKVSFDAHALGAQHIFEQSGAPVGMLVDDIWIDTGNNNIMKRWDGSAWQLIDDSRIAQALTLAGNKNTIYRQSTAPVSGMVTNDLWVDSDDGKLYVYTGGSWVLSDDQRIATALTNAANAQTSADQIDATNLNPSVSTWSNPAAAPEQWFAWNTLPTRETTLIRTPPYAARFNCTDTTTNRGLQQTGQVNLPIGLQYVTATVDVMLNSGTSFGGAGMLLDWVGMTGTIRGQISLATEIPTPVTGKWYRVTKVIPRPTAATGTQTSWSMWMMGQYVGGTLGTAAVKDVIFNRLAVRPSTTEEISAYNAAPQSTVTTLTNTVNTKTSIFSQVSAPSSTGRVIGDMWIDTDDNQRVYVWNGSSWGLTDIANYNYIISRATDLVTNGTGTLGTNQNFSQWTFDTSDAPVGSAGSFITPFGVAATRIADELMPVDTTKTYKFSFQARQRNTLGGYMYSGLQAFDAFKNAIGPQHVMYTANTLTTLAVALNPGDTTITLTSSTNWWGTSGKPAGASTYLRSIIWWDYTDPGGKLWPELTYSRNVSGSNYWADGGITGNVITLAAPYSGPSRPIGTKLSNGSSGGTYMYGGASNTQVPVTWTQYSATITGIAQGGLTPSFGNGWPYGTAFGRLLWLTNYTSAALSTDTTSQHAIASVSFSDAAAAYDRAAHITTYYQTSQPASGMITGDFWVDTDDGNKLYRYSGSTWQVAQDQGIGQAITAAAGAQATADGKVRLYAQTSAPTGLLSTDDGDLWVDTDDSNKLYRFNGSSLAWVLIQDAAGALAQANTALTTANGKNKVTWSTSSPGSTANSAGDVWFVLGVSGGVLAQWQGQGGTTWAQQPIQDSVITSLTAAKLTTGSLTAGNDIIAGNVNGSHARMTSTGFKVFVDDPVDLVPNEVVRMGSETDDILAISDATGAAVAAIDERGHVQAQGASLGVDGPVYAVDGNGDTYLDQGVEIYGEEFNSIIDPLPRGVVAFGYRTTTPTTYTTTTEAPYQQVDCIMYGGRLYRIGAKGYLNGDTAGMRSLAKLRIRTDGLAAGITDTQLMSQRVTIPTANNSMPFTMMHHYAYAVGPPDGTSREASVVLTYLSESTGGTRITASITDSCELWVEDMGLYYGDVGIDRSGGTPPPTKKTYVSTWTASNSESYSGSNAARTDTTDLVQGYNSFNGDGHAVVIFGSANSTGGETGKTIATALTGATLNKVEVYLYFNHWYYNSGGTAIIRAYNSTSLSSATPTGSTKQSSSWPKPGGRWVDITSVSSASIRGITIGKSGGTNLLYYGRANYQGASSGKPALRLTYTK